MSTLFIRKRPLSLILYRHCQVITRRIIILYRSSSDASVSTDTNFPGIIGKVTSLVSHHRRVQTAEERNFFPCSLLFFFFFFFFFLPRLFLPFVLLRVSSFFPAIVSLHGELNAAVSWERRLVSFPSRFHAIVGVCQPADTCSFFPHPFPVAQALLVLHESPIPYTILVLHRTRRISGAGTASGRVTIGK